MAQPREKPWLKNKNHLDRTENNDNTQTPKGKKPELMVFDFSDNAVGEAGNDEPDQGSSPRIKDEETSPRDTARKERGTPDESLDSNRSPRQETGDKTSPRGPAANDKSPRSEQESPRKADNQLKIAETRNRRASPLRDGYEADTDSNDKPAAPARRGRDQSPDKMSGGKPKPSDTSPRASKPERPSRNTFTGKSTLSL